MTTDEILAELVAMGARPELILQIVRALDAAAQTVDRRARNRDRMRVVRARAPTEAHMDAQDAGYMKEESKQGRKISIAIASDWMPTEVDRAYSRSKGWNDERIAAEAERFLAYYQASGKAMKDWAACWRKWVTSPYQKNSQGGQAHGRRHGSVLDAFDRLGEKLRQAGATDDYVPGSSGPRPLELDQKMRQPSLKLIPKG